MTTSNQKLAAVLRLVSRFWLKEVSLDELEAIAEPQFADVYREVGGHIPNQISDEIVDALAVSYCELLIGPKNQVSPIQSVWTENQYQSRTASSMMRFFELLPGYRASEEMADHIGVQLDFAASVIETEQAEANQILGLFAKEHFSWTHRFLDTVKSRADSMNSEAGTFYSGLASVTAALISEITELGQNQLTSKSQ